MGSWSYALRAHKFMNEVISRYSLRGLPALPPPILCHDVSLRVFKNRVSNVCPSASWKLISGPEVSYITFNRTFASPILRCPD